MLLPICQFHAFHSDFIQENRRAANRNEMRWIASSIRQSGPIFPKGDAQKKIILRFFLLPKRNWMILY